LQAANNNFFMDFIEIKVECNPDFAEIFMAEFSEIGFNSFMENDKGFDAYIEENLFREEDVLDIKNRYSLAGGFTFLLKKIEKKNWNEEWEKNYDPIIVSDQCIVKATFHNISKSYPFEILINPKMSFGTGHHATTFLMLTQQLGMPFADKLVLDAGCGTGILGIMASMAGAEKVDCCDIDEWSVENSVENFALNNCDNINIFHGKTNSIPVGSPYDIILANINKNVLLEEIATYSQLQSPEGYLLLSGFYEEDIDDIENCCFQQQYEKVGYLIKDRWACTKFKKIKTNS